MRGDEDQVQAERIRGEEGMWGERQPVSPVQEWTGGCGRRIRENVTLKKLH